MGIDGLSFFSHGEANITAEETAEKKHSCSYCTCTESPGNTRFADLNSLSLINFIISDANASGSPGQTAAWEVGLAVILDSTAALSQLLVILRDTGGTAFFSAERERKSRQSKRSLHRNDKTFCGRPCAVQSTAASGAGQHTPDLSLKYLPSCHGGTSERTLAGSSRCQWISCTELDQVLQSPRYN